MSEVTQDEQVNVINTAAAPSGSTFDDPQNADYVGEPEVIDKEFVYVTHLDPARQADKSGVYLDDVERRKAEIIRAQVEGREPDLVNPPAVQSTPMVTLEQAVKNYSTEAVLGVTDNTVTLPVSVGIADANLDGYGDAIKRREEKAGNEAEADNTQSEVGSDPVTEPSEPKTETGEGVTVTPTEPESTNFNSGTEGEIPNSPGDSEKKVDFS